MKCRLESLFAVMFLFVAAVEAQTPQTYIRKKIGATSAYHFASGGQDKNSFSEMSLPASVKVDTLLTPVIPFTPMAVGLYGYTKRLNDAKESFVLRNETHNYHISRVVLKFIYTTEAGEALHSREETIECDLMPGEARMLSVKSFDVSKMYYYYTMPPKRASGVPYRVQYDLLRYDVVVE